MEIARDHDGTNNGRLGLSIRRASERCNIDRGTAQRAFAELQEHGFVDCMTKGAFSRKALHVLRMESNLVGLRCHRRASEREVHELGPRKSKRGIKYSVAGSIRSTARRNGAKNRVTVPLIDTVHALKPALPVSIEGTHMVYHRLQGGSRSAPPRSAVASKPPLVLESKAC